MRVFTVAAAVLLISGCAAPQATDAEKDAATRAFGECVQTAAPGVDDGVSDARTIGSAAATACHREANAMIDAFAAGMSPAGRELYRPRFQRLVVDLATNTVLRLRVSSR